MTVFNRIKFFIESNRLTYYRFRKDTGLSEDIAYRLYKDRSYIPTPQVLEIICSTYRIQPGLILDWIPDLVIIDGGEEKKTSVHDISHQNYQTDK